jgi:hypothetical protein
MTCSDVLVFFIAVGGVAVGGVAVGGVAVGGALFGFCWEEDMSILLLLL